MRRSSLIWGVVLLLLGGLMLADAAGLKLPNGNALTSLFFPMLLIAFGAWVLFGVFIRRTAETESASVDLQGATEASLRVNHGAGEFHLHSGASGSEFVRGSFVGGVEQKTSLENSKLHVKLRPATDFIGFGPQAPLDWDVALNAAIPTSLDLNLGANKSTLDLRDLKITGLRLKSGASDSLVTLPATGRLSADFEIGAAALTLVLPEGVAIRVHASIGAGDLSMDRARFPQNTSPDFDTAANAVDIHIKGGACSVKVK